MPFFTSKDTKEISVLDVGECDISMLYNGTDLVLVLHISVQTDKVVHIIHVHVSTVVPAY